MSSPTKRKGLLKRGSIVGTKEEGARDSSASKSPQRAGISPGRKAGVTPLDMSVVGAGGTGPPGRMDSEELLKPRSNREVHQPPGTVLKINAPEWNNVPPITYEAIVTLVNEIDSMNRRAETSKTEVKRTFDDQKLILRTSESTARDERAVLNAAIGESAATLSHSLSHSIQDVNGRMNNVSKEQQRTEEQCASFKQQLSKLNKSTEIQVNQFMTLKHETLSSIKDLHQSIHDNKTNYDGKFTEIFNNFNVRVICLGEELGWKEQEKYAAERGQEPKRKTTSSHTSQDDKNEDEMNEKDNEQLEATAEAMEELQEEPPFENYIEFIRHLQSKPFEMLEKERNDTVNGLDQLSEDLTKKMRKLNGGLEAKLDGLLLQLSKQEKSLRKDFDQLASDLNMKGDEQASKQATLHSQLDDQLEDINNKIKNQQLKFTKMLDQINGDCETREERLRKLIEEQEKAHSLRNKSQPKRSSPTVSTRKEGLNDIQTRQVEEMITLMTAGMQTRNASPDGKETSPDALGSNDGSLQPRLQTRSYDNGPDKELHYRAEARFKDNQQSDYKQDKQMAGSLPPGSGMTTKRVRVDRRNRRFEEDVYIYDKDVRGEVRKYAHDLKSYQQSLNTGEQTQQEFSVTGLKTGSDFYPRGGCGTTGIPAGPYYAVQTLSGGHRDSSGSGERAIIERTTATGEKPQTGNTTMPKIRNTSRGHLKHARNTINQQSSNIMAQPKRLSTGLSYVTSHEARPVRRIAALQGQIGGGLFEVQSMATPHTTVQQMESLHMNEMFQLPQEQGKGQPLAVLFEDMRMAKAELRSQIRHKTPNKQGVTARMHL